MHFYVCVALTMSVQCQINIQLINFRAFLPSNDVNKEENSSEALTKLSHVYASLEG